ncbi:endonuclease/exonuclease/phosphatase family protein [Ureaplasma miroungigenitalium]|uniref:endonuclease/exonuclease/phosphatase family protein n=1 Tax=Ureaplasma miroungigenitalium TaxID=1042321 RepID=UPI0021E94863|nr:endonuclease/exonuclease/phosphatase family protein [Ureaplasma miroungigenitalium]MCV3733999.1 endonuclease/exonuclease/phosphatase family protein [Ureaplasma miroungigenitalium]
MLKRLKKRLNKKVLLSIGLGLTCALPLTLATSCFLTKKPKEQTNNAQANNNDINDGDQSNQIDDQDISIENEDEIVDEDEDDSQDESTIITDDQGPMPSLDAAKRLSKNPNYWRIGHWNVLNQGGTNELKNLLLAKTINYLNLDVIALTEINAYNVQDQAVTKIIDSLNTLNPTNPYTYILSDELYSPKFATQKERVAFIYRKNVFDVKQEFYFLKDKKTNTPYELDQVILSANPADHAKQKATKITYSRTPYGITLIDKKRENDFSILAVHLDSPGDSKNKAARKQDYKYAYKNGTKELNEAYHLSTVMRLFDKFDGQNEDLILTGDTNVRGKNFNIAFGALSKSPLNYRSLLSASLKTSLGVSFSKYTSAYDKLFLRTDYQSLNNAEQPIFENAKMFDLWQIGNPIYNIVTDEIRMQVLNEWIIKKPNGKKVKARYTDEQKATLMAKWKQFDDPQIRKTMKKEDRDQVVKFVEFLVRKTTSDHAPVFFDMYIDHDDISKETRRK